MLLYPLQIVSARARLFVGFLWDLSGEAMLSPHAYRDRDLDSP
jgi:hypothetical protein